MHHLAATDPHPLGVHVYLESLPFVGDMLAQDIKIIAVVESIHGGSLLLTVGSALWV